MTTAESVKDVIISCAKCHVVKNFTIDSWIGGVFCWRHCQKAVAAEVRIYAMMLFSVKNQEGARYNLSGYSNTAINTVPSSAPSTSTRSMLPKNPPPVM